ncbi:MAG: PAS domain S-box protein [Ferruginibacter sp.]
MKNIQQNKIIRIAFVIAIFSISYLAYATYVNMKNAIVANNNLKISLDTQFHLDSILTDIQEIESNQRSFIISGNEKYVNDYHTGLNKIKKDTAFDETLNFHEQQFQELYEQLVRLITHKIENINYTLELNKIYGLDSARRYITRGKGKLLMDSVNVAIVALKYKTQLKLTQANNYKNNFIREAFFTFSMVCLLFIIILGVNYFLKSRDNKLLLASEKRLKFNASLIRNISDPIITTDAAFRITNWNKYAEELYGYTEEEVRGKEINKILKIEYPKHNQDKILKNYSKVDYWKGEVIHYNKKNDPLDVEVTTSSIKDEKGEKAGTVTVIRDITSRKKADEKLNRLTTTLQEQVELKTAELSKVFERITDAFIALDNDWKYTYVNTRAAQMHGKIPADLLGKNIWDEFPDVVNEPFYEALHEAKKTQQALKLQLPYSKTGRWFEDLIYPSDDGISVYYHDITEEKRAQIALEIAHERLNNHITNTPLAVVEYDADLVVLQWSEKAEEMFGWNKEEILNKPLIPEGFVHHDDVAKVKEQLARLNNKDVKSGTLHNRNITKDGRVIYCEWYNSVLKDEEGNSIGVLSLVQDVTGRTLVEIELQEAEAKFRNLVEKSLVGVYIIQDGKFVYVNPMFAQLFGYKMDDILDKDVNIIVYEKDKELVETTMQDRFSGLNKSSHYEFKGLHAAGYIVEVEVYGTLTQYKGNKAIIGTLINITERKKALQLLGDTAKKLAISNERFNLIAKATNDAIWDWDMETNNMWGNEIFRNIFSLHKGTKLAYGDFLERLHPDDAPILLENFKNALRNKVTFLSEEFRFKMADGNYRSLYDRAYIVYDEKGRAYRMVGAMQDVTIQKRFQEQIILEKELSDSIINSLPGIFYLFNSQGKFSRWNDNFEKVSGYSSEEINNLNPLELFDEEEKDLLQQKLANVFVAGEDNVEAHFLTKSGEKIPYYFNGMVIKYEGETCLLGVGIDISDRVIAQQKIEESEEKFRMLIDQASDGIFISSQAGNYEEVNRNATELTGYTREELLNMTMTDLVLKEDYESNPFMLAELMRGESVINERTFLRKDGSLLDVEISAKQLPDGRFQGIVRDITERKKTEEALKLSEHKYRLLFDQNPMPMWMISLPERRFLDVNTAAIEFYGYSRKEFLEMTVKDIRPPDDIPEFQSRLNTYRSGINNAGIWRHKKKNGSIVKVSIITHDVIFEGQHAKLVLGTDVTEKLIAEESLKKSHEEYRQLATHLETIREAERTHMAREIHDELGQQLTGLKMDISWINKRLKSEDNEIKQKIKETIQLIDTTVKTVRRIATALRPSILDDLGLIAAMEWQSEEFEKRSEIKSMFSSNVNVVEINNEIATGIFRIYQESLTNVLRHADATQVNAFMQIKDNVLILNISDNGKGFNAVEIQNKKTLGLLGMKERTMLMGGSYEINSKPGKGTAVIIIVPLT